MSNVIAIGALGGSGTRIVAEILMDAGVYMGDELNYPNDNLIFTRLFKNPEWYKNATAKDLNKRLVMFSNYMQHSHLSIRELIWLLQLTKKDPKIKGNIHLYYRYFKKCFKNKQSKSTWGWKEPNTQIYFDEIFYFFPRLKYIHVIRHGLEMAFSKNTTQLLNWGFKYKIHLTGSENKEELAVKQLDYWIESTKDILTKSKKYKSNFYLLKHENLYINPTSEIDKLLQFTHLSLQPDLLNELYKLPKKPDTAKQFKDYSLSIFRKDQLEFVESLGFEI